MILGMHAMFYSSEADALRAFIKEKLELAATDVGEGWLIFDAPGADLGVHPTESNNPPSGTAEISFYCDDIEETISDLKGKGSRVHAGRGGSWLRARNLLQGSGCVQGSVVPAEVQEVVGGERVRRRAASWPAAARRLARTLTSACERCTSVCFQHPPTAALGRTLSLALPQEQTSRCERDRRWQAVRIHDRFRRQCKRQERQPTR